MKNFFPLLTLALPTEGGRSRAPHDVWLTSEAGGIVGDVSGGHTLSIFTKPTYNAIVDLGTTHHNSLTTSLLEKIEVSKIVKDIAPVGEMLFDVFSPDHCVSLSNCGATPQISPTIPVVVDAFKTMGYDATTTGTDSVVVEVEGGKVTYRVEEGTDWGFLSEVVMFNDFASSLKLASASKTSSDCAATTSETAFLKTRGALNFREGSRKLKVSLDIMGKSLGSVVDAMTASQCGGVVGFVEDASRRRSLSDSAGDDYKGPTLDFIADYQITLWLSVGLIAVVFTVVIMLACLDPNMDNMLLATFKADVGEGIKYD